MAETLGDVHWADGGMVHAIPDSPTVYEVASDRPDVLAIDAPRRN